MIKRGSFLWKRNLGKKNKKANSHFDFLFGNKSLLKSKRSPRIFMPHLNKILPASKRSQEVFGMPFATIFSIFLIVVFVVVAIYVIMHVIGWGECVENGLFIDDFQGAIDEAWKSQSSSKTFSSSLSGIKYVCFANLSKATTGTATAKEKEIYRELRIGEDNANLFFYPQGKACIPSANIKHVNMAELTNPYCIPVENGKVEIKIEKGFYDALVKVAKG